MQAKILQLKFAILIAFNCWVSECVFFPPNIQAVQEILALLPFFLVEKTAAGPCSFEDLNKQQNLEAQPIISKIVYII
jgi:hypothetical protein